MIFTSKIIIRTDDDSLSFDGNRICAVEGSKEYVFDTEEVRMIAILTSDKGPFEEDMWMFVAFRDDREIYVPSEHRCYEPFLFDEIGKVLPIDHKKIIEASSCTDNELFIIYSSDAEDMYEVSDKIIEEESKKPMEKIKLSREGDGIKVSGTVSLGYIGTFEDSQIELDDTLDEIRDWDIVTDNLDEDCTDDEIVEFLEKYFNEFFDKVDRNIENINGTFLLQTFVDMDNAEINFMTIDELFIEEKLIYGNEEDIAEIYNYAREGLNSLYPYLESPNDGTIPKGHVEGVLRSFFPMFDFDCFIENIIPEYLHLDDGEISFQCSDDFDEAILCGAYAVLDEELAFDDWHNF